MTYRPAGTGSGRGRKPLPIPPALLALLRQSDATGARIEIERRPDDPPGAAEDLRRALVRAGYTHFPTRTIRKRITDDRITFWVTDKRRSST